jgi:hypothetical protein
MKTNTEIAEEIWQEAYQGGSNSIQRAADEYIEENGQIDELAIMEIIDRDLGFICVGCDWICEISELSEKAFEEMVCINCEEDY